MARNWRGAKNMQLFKRFSFTLLFFVFSTSAAHADLGFWSAALVGKWRHPQNGDLYEFRSNATYTFRAGAAKRRVGKVSHSGFWKIVQPTEKESGGSMEGPVALLLKSRNRGVLVEQKWRVLGSNRVLRLVVDVAKSQDAVVDNSAYFIGRAKWKRVKR